MKNRCQIKLLENINRDNAELNTIIVDAAFICLKNSCLDLKAIFTNGIVNIKQYY